MYKESYRPHDDLGTPRHDGPSDQRPYLCIPYWTVPLSPTEPPDNGVERPLPATVISWDCPGIHAGAYSPGLPLDVTVDVVNAGGGNQTALVTASVYWAEPTVGFVKPEFLGACVVPVSPRGGRARSPLITGVIPASASNHICLLAVVTHPLDPAGKVIDPLNKRHWAQRNLFAVSASAGQQVRFPFTVANQFHEEGVFELLARPLREKQLSTLGLRLRATPLEEGIRSLHLEDSTGRLIAEDRRTPVAEFKLKAGGTRTAFLVLDLDRNLEPHEFTAVEVLLNHHSEKMTKTFGSLGLVIQPPRDRGT